MIADMDAARETISVLYYIWLDDQTGRDVAEALIRAVRRGVRCRAMVDAIGSHAFVRSRTWRRMTDAGVRTSVTLPLGSSRLLALGVELGSPTAALVQPGWSWQLGAAYRHERIGAGGARTLVRNGLPVGSALQPRIVQRHLGASAGATYRF